MMDKKIRAIVVLSEFPKGENPFGAVDWDKVKKAGFAYVALDLQGYRTGAMNETLEKTA